MMQEFDVDVSTGRTFRLRDFEGPLDLLLYLIKRTR